MKRTVLYADEGMILTDGEIFGKVIYLAEGKSADAFEQITEEEFLRSFESGVLVDQATEEDYKTALREFGVVL